MDNASTLSRRVFLKGTLAAAAVVGAGCAIDGVFGEPNWIECPEVPVAVPSLLKAFVGYRILHVTDIHMGTPGSEDRLHRLVEICNRTGCDLIAFTGDFVSFKKSIGGLSEALSQIKRPPNGMVAVLGNHDHWTDHNALQKTLERHGIEDLTNRGLPIERAGSALWICGTGDLWEDRVDVSTAVKDAPPDITRILLSHNPDVAETHVFPEHRISLQLSGHTHGGQVKIPFGPAPLVPSAYGQKYRAGLVKAPHTQVFVSKGVGVISHPVRFNCRPEVPILRLVSCGIDRGPRAL